MIVTAAAQLGTSRDLVRVLSCCLAVLFLLQTLAATVSTVAGPPHRHSEAVFDRLGAAHAAAHARNQAHAHAHAHGHAHAHAHAHAHDADDHGAMTDEQLFAADVASLQLLTLLLALAPAQKASVGVTGHRLPEALALAFSSHAIPPPRRPPRA